MAPTSVNGKICYIELPATDVPRSAEFYQNVFRWNMRTRGDGATAFDDTTGEVSGAFVRGRPPASAPGLLIGRLRKFNAQTRAGTFAHFAGKWAARLFRRQTCHLTLAIFNFAQLPQDGRLFLNILSFRQFPIFQS